MHEWIAGDIIRESCHWFKVNIMKKTFLADSLGLAGGLMRVYLSENAFIDLLLSSAEVYKKECLGFLLGYKLEDRFIIEHAFSFQTASRKPKGVASLDGSHKKIEPILARLGRLQIIGDFHSHTQFGVNKGLPNPSQEDIDGMTTGDIYVIVAINNNRKTRPGQKTG
jgi:proteasome lid subunit RPN8/RPN11